MTCENRIKIHRVVIELHQICKKISFVKILSTPKHSVQIQGCNCCLCKQEVLFSGLASYLQGSKISIKTCGPVGLVDLLIYRPDNEVNKSDKFPPNFNFLYLQQHLNKNLRNKYKNINDSVKAESLKNRKIIII